MLIKKLVVAFISAIFVFNVNCKDISAAEYYSDMFMSKAEEDEFINNFIEQDFLMFDYFTEFIEIHGDFKYAAVDVLSNYTDWLKGIVKNEVGDYEKDQYKKYIVEILENIDLGSIEFGQLSTEIVDYIDNGIILYDELSTHFDILDNNGLSYYIAPLREDGFTKNLERVAIGINAGNFTVEQAAFLMSDYTENLKVLSVISYALNSLYDGDNKIKDAVEELIDEYTDKYAALLDNTSGFLKDTLIDIIASKSSLHSIVTFAIEKSFDYSGGKEYAENVKATIFTMGFSQSMRLCYEEITNRNYDILGALRESSNEESWTEMVCLFNITKAGYLEVYENMYDATSDKTRKERIQRGISILESLVISETKPTVDKIIYFFPPWKEVKLYKELCEQIEARELFPTRTDIVDAEKFYELVMGLTENGDLWVDGNYYYDEQFKGHSSNGPIKLLSNVKEYGNNEMVSYAITNNDELYLWGVIDVRNPQKVMDNAKDVTIGSLWTTATIHVYVRDLEGNNFEISPYGDFTKWSIDLEIEDAYEELKSSSSVFAVGSRFEITEDHNMRYTTFNYLDDDDSTEKTEIILTSVYDQLDSNRFVLMDGTVVEIKFIYDDEKREIKEIGNIIDVLREKESEVTDFTKVDSDATQTVITGGEGNSYEDNNILTLSKILGAWTSKNSEGYIFTVVLEENGTCYFNYYVENTSITEEGFGNYTVKNNIISLDLDTISFNEEYSKTETSKLNFNLSYENGKLHGKFYDEGTSLIYERTDEYRTFNLR